MRKNYTEQDMIAAIHKKRKLEPKIQAEFEIFQQMLPAIRAAIKAGGGADAVLKKSETIAAVELVKATQSEKEEIRLKASTEILNRTIGRPVERSINIYGDISKMNENDVDNQILQLLGKTGAKKLLEATEVIPKKRKLQKRKPRINETIDVEATTRPADAVSEPVASPETGTPSES